MTISDLFIQSVLEKINSPGVIGVGISGSVARGQVAKYSDVDFEIFVGKLPEREFDQSTLRYWSEKLVSLKYVTIEDERAAMMDPRRAIWVVPALRQMKIVLDSTGALAKLQKAALVFEWSPLQPAADEFAVEQVMGCAEEVHKVLNGLARSHESTVMYAVWGMLKQLPEAVMVQKGLMITSENRFFDLIQEDMGRDTKWVSAFRTAWGLDSPSSQYQARGAAALMLYRLTAGMFEELIPENHREVINRTLRLIKEAGYS